MSDTKKTKEERARYQVLWQRKYRKFLAKQGLKQVRLICHKDFEKQLRGIALMDIERRKLSTSVQNSMQKGEKNV